MYEMNRFTQWKHDFQFGVFPPELNTIIDRMSTHLHDDGVFFIFTTRASHVLISSVSQLTND